MSRFQRPTLRLDDADGIDAAVDAALAGDKDAFCDVMHVCYDEVRAFIAVRAPNLEITDDVLQSTMVTCWSKLVKYEKRGSFVSWLKV